jgi:hypothetical protein
LNNSKIKILEGRITRVKEKIIELGEMRPGSISKQYNVCGNPKCRCKDKEDPRKHGPYYQLNYTHRGKGKTEFVKKENLAQTKMEIKNFLKLKELMAKWTDLSLEIAKIRRVLNKKV